LEKSIDSDFSKALELMQHKQVKLAIKKVASKMRYAFVMANSLGVVQEDDQMEEDVKTLRQVLIICFLFLAEEVTMKDVLK
jgi:hypothetical protein